ncbi:hypothetical protein [Microbispora sp. CSR-4]|nr:hypothetical protein [Microbispora sp. CSR-4]
MRRAAIAAHLLSAVLLAAVTCFSGETVGGSTRRTGRSRTPSAV